MSENKMLTASDILEANDIVVEEVYVSEWGGTVRLQSMSGDEVVEFVEKYGQDKNMSAARIVVMCAVDGEGNRLFTDDQIEPLKKKSFSAILKLQKVALRINGMKDDEEESVKKV
jgi:hypothetical protein